MLWTGLSGISFAQDSLALKYEIRGEVTRGGEKFFSRHEAVEDFVKSLIRDLRSQGFLMAHIQKNEQHDRSRDVMVVTGDRFKWLHVSGGNVPQWLQEKVGFDPKKFSKTPISHQEVLRVFDGILRDRENKGYPFAEVKLDSIRQSEEGISASLYLVNGPLITFDSLQVQGGTKINPAYLSKYLDIVPGELFSQKKVDEAMGRLNRLRAIKILAAPYLSFQNSEATVYFALADRDVNTIDGIVGFLPNEVEQNKILVTGQFDLELFNVSGRGRDYKLHWQRLRQYTQNLYLSAEEPMVFGSGIDVNAIFSLLKEDTTFINRDFNLGFSHQIGPMVDIGFFTSWRSGDLLSVPALEDETLPDVLDYRYNNYGTKLSLFHLDDAFLPKRGWGAEFELGVGNKKVLQNTGIQDELYDDIDLESIQYYSKFSLENYWNWTRRFLARSRISGGLIEGGNLLKNDMFRLGGLNTIRGFNENFFFANRYVYTNFEPRFYFEEQSYFMVFVDWARLEQKGRMEAKKTDHVFSLGGGLSFEAGNGAFQFVIGLGKSNEQQMGANYAKVHFGYTGRF